MISDIADWDLINMLINPSVSMSLLALIILIVAGFLMSEKPIKKYSFKRILGAVLFVFAIFVFLFANIADLADVFTVWATLILAGVAIFSFEESRRLREETRRIREEHNQEERHRLALERIRNWSEELFGLVTRPTRYRILQARKQELEGLLHLGGAKSIGILKDAELVGGNVLSSVNTANLSVFEFSARLRGEQDIAEFKARYRIQTIVKPIEDTTELEEQKKELLAALSEVITSAAKEMGPRL